MDSDINMCCEDFYSRIEPFETFSQTTAFRHYAHVPDSWALVVTDVEGSTDAIRRGRYRDVNALGVASIVAVRNAMPDVSIPFVFGGDGATLLVPLSRRRPLEKTLRALRSMAHRTFGLSLRVGMVSIAELRKSGHDVMVGKYRASNHIELAAFAGSGVAEGERRIKDPCLGRCYAVSAGDEDEGEADLSGFECRWRPVASRRGQVMCLLVAPTCEGHDAQADVLGRIIAHIEGIVDPDDQGCPVSYETLRMSSFFSDFSQEVGVKAQTDWKKRLNRWLRVRTALLVARLTHWTGATIAGYSDGRYRREVVVNTDFRKFDGVLRMVIDVTRQQRRRIESLLVREQRLGRIVWGVHTSNATLMTCMVDGYAGNHVHFVDGADGGYALAAAKLKSNLPAPEQVTSTRRSLPDASVLT